MIEVADFVGSDRDVLVVVDDITGETPAIGGDRLSRREVEDLNRGRAFVRAITDESGCLMQSTVHKAVTALVDLSRWGQCSSEDNTTPSHTSHQEPLHKLLTNKLRLIQQLCTMYDADRRGHLTMDEAEQALLSLHCDWETLESTLKTVSETSGCLPWKQNRISFEGFCVLYAEARHHALAGREDEGGLLAATAGYVRGGLERVAGWLWSSPPVPPSTTGTPSHLPHTTHCDVYLGGSCGATSWRRDDIIPILNQHGVTFFDPQVSEWDPSLISVEQAAKNQCSVLLFAIGGDTLSVASMVEAAYYMGRGRRLVLVLSDIPQPPQPGSCTTVEGMQLSSRAVRDYNRGRAYLASIAQKREVPLYTSTVDAALHAVYIVKGYDVPLNSTDHVPLQGTSV
jgi:hypothetical protein